MKDAGDDSGFIVQALGTVAIRASAPCSASSRPWACGSSSHADFERQFVDSDGNYALRPQPSDAA